MSWVAVDKDGSEYIFQKEPSKTFVCWLDTSSKLLDGLYIPKGSIKKLIGRDLTWEDEPVELREG